MPFIHHRPTERVLDILELLANHPDGLTLTEISQALSAPKSSIMPLVHTMAARKFIYSDTCRRPLGGGLSSHNTSRYKIGIAAFSTGSSYASGKQVLQFLHERMRQIVAESGEICQLGVEDRNMLLYVAKEESDEPIRLISHVGKHLPLYCTAMGKILLTYKTPSEIRELYPNGLEPVTPKTVVAFEELFQTLNQFRVQNYAIEHEEATEHIHCIAVALCKGEIPIAGLSVSVPGFRMTEEKCDLIIRLLKDAKQKIETYFRDCDIDTLSL